MSTRIQVILKEEVAEFKHQARKQSKSLSALMREAAYRMLQENEKKDLTEVNALKKFLWNARGVRQVRNLTGVNKKCSFWKGIIRRLHHDLC